MCTAMICWSVHARPAEGVGDGDGRPPYDTCARQGRPTTTHVWRPVMRGNSSHAGVKQAFDVKYPPVDNKATSGVYHCIVGTNFACSVTHETHFSCYLTCDNVSPACRKRPPLGSATARHPGSAGWRVARRTRGRALAAPISTRACGAAVSACQRSRHPPFCGCTAGLSATRRTRHDGPLGCAGSHVWQLRGGPCLPPSVPPQVSLLIYKSKDSPFD